MSITAFVFVMHCAACGTACQWPRRQQVTGELGTPGATTTIDGKQLPAPTPPFGGVIKDDALQSTPWWAPRIVPPKGAPNVLLIMTDDSGYGVPSHLRRRHPDPGARPRRRQRPALHADAFDGAVLAHPCGAHHRPQPSFGGLRRHLRAVDGLSGLQQHHRHRTRPPSAASCRDNGYATSWFGKDHNVPAFQASQAGPFDQWPIGHGIRIFLWLRRRRRQPVAAQPVPQHHADLSLRGQAGLEPHHRHGG